MDWFWFNSFYLDDDDHNVCLFYCDGMAADVIEVVIEQGIELEKVDLVEEFHFNFHF